MQIMMKSSSGIHTIALESRLLADRMVYLQGEIDAEMACRFEQQIMYLLNEAPDKPIRIYLNSPGGGVSPGLHIYDVLKSIPVETTLWARGTTASMGAILLAGGQKGRRLILPHAKVMLHEPLIDGGLGGSATSIQRTAASILETKEIMVELLARDTGKSKAVIEQAIAFDNYMNAQEAVQFGIADKVVSSLFEEVGTHG